MTVQLNCDAHTLRFVRGVCEVLHIDIRSSTASLSTAHLVGLHLTVCRPLSGFQSFSSPSGTNQSRWWTSDWIGMT